MPGEHLDGVGGDRALAEREAPLRQRLRVVEAAVEDRLHGADRRQPPHEVGMTGRRRERRERAMREARLRHVAERERVGDDPAAADHGELAVVALLGERHHLGRGGEPLLDVVGARERGDPAAEGVGERRDVAESARHGDGLVAERALPGLRSRPIERDREPAQESGAQHAVGVVERRRAPPRGWARRARSERSISPRPSAARLSSSASRARGRARRRARTWPRPPSGSPARTCAKPSDKQERAVARLVVAAAALEEVQRPLVVRDGLLVGERLGRAVAGADAVVGWRARRRRRRPLRGNDARARRRARRDRRRRRPRSPRRSGGGAGSRRASGMSP